MKFLLRLKVIVKLFKEVRRLRRANLRLSDNLKEAGNLIAANYKRIDEQGEILKSLLIQLREKDRQIANFHFFHSFDPKKEIELVKELYK